jgi:hypothetical protein
VQLNDCFFTDEWNIINAHPLLSDLDHWGVIMAIAKLARPSVLPKNFPERATAYPLPLFRLQVEAARRYLFENELKECLTAASIPLEILGMAEVEIALTILHVAKFMQNLKQFVGDEKALAYGHEALSKATAVIPKPTIQQPILRGVSPADKAFLRVREALAVLNRQLNTDIIIKRHGDTEADIFEDSGLHCYGFVAEAPACQTLTGFFEEAILYLSGSKVKLVETECMALGALACRWHCYLQ